jgi:hypothetical protein
MSIHKYLPRCTTSSPSVAHQHLCTPRLPTLLHVCCGCSRRQSSACTLSILKRICSEGTAYMTSRPSANVWTILPKLNATALITCSQTRTVSPCALDGHSQHLFDCWQAPHRDGPLPKTNFEKRHEGESRFLENQRETRPRKDQKFVPAPPRFEKNVKLPAEGKSCDRTRRGRVVFAVILCIISTLHPTVISV